MGSMALNICCKVVFRCGIGTTAAGTRIRNITKTFLCNNSSCKAWMCYIDSCINNADRLAETCEVCRSGLPTMNKRCVNEWNAVIEKDMENFILLNTFYIWIYKKLLQFFFVYFCSVKIS